MALMMSRFADLEAAKRSMRRDIITARRTTSPGGSADLGTALARKVLGTTEVRHAQAIAAYVSTGTEPPTAPLLEALRGRGVRVLLPVLLPDADLDWAEYEGDDALALGDRGIRHPTGERLGRDAVARVDVVVVPALAVDWAGRRLGRGGGSYDRALARVDSRAWACALLWDGELVDDVPAAEHDMTVDAVATPSGIVRLPAEPLGPSYIPRAFGNP